MNIEFNEALHQYRLDGRVVPSVTQVIRSNVQGWMADDWYLERGRAVHAAIHLHLRGKLDWASVDERIKGRIDAILKFLADLNLSIVDTEVRMASTRWRFAGTIDAILQDASGMLLVADWKSTLEPSVEPQLGAYCCLHTDNVHIAPSRAVAVECHDNGTYKCKWGSRTPRKHDAGFNLKDAENTFLSMLSVHNFKAKHKLNGKE